ncbi:hypothetical protein [Tenuifilum thalassicum]|uniref:Uncharacterized protein n=1 Tax=Tenuifilum thalassicum TaxID=2590900 RepID=A0A7D3Y4B0_9BACT|nr:hypothetical protein [Tenuifilum thalassicum]QKG79909.1 hypothetical protein FHG85_06415 [Tenuifilum thalassicum]
MLKNIYSVASHFNEDSLFNKMNQITPGIINFTNTYIVDDIYPDIRTFLSKAGFNYSKVIKEYGYYFPIKILEIKDSSVIISFYETVVPFKRMNKLN